MNLTVRIPVPLLILLLFSFALQGAILKNVEEDSLKCLEIIGRIGNAAENETPCKVELISMARVLDSVILEKGNKKFSFTLNRNSYYAIRVSKPGFIPKIVSVETKFPDEIIDLISFSFNTDLIPEALAKSLNQDALDFPIAIITFDPRTECFIHVKEYTELTKREIYQGGSDGQLDQTF